MFPKIDVPLLTRQTHHASLLCVTRFTDDRLLKTCTENSDLACKLLQSLMFCYQQLNISHALTFKGYVSDKQTRQRCFRAHKIYERLIFKVNRPELISSVCVCVCASEAFWKRWEVMCNVLFTLVSDSWLRGAESGLLTD